MKTKSTFQLVIATTIDAVIVNHMTTTGGSSVLSEGMYDELYTGDIQSSSQSYSNSLTLKMKKIDN